MQSKTKAVYLPLIDMVPSNQDTIKTTLHEAKRVANERGQKNTILSSDQQLYNVAVYFQWAYTVEFSDVILRLGWMHMLMSFVSAIGTLMSETGISEILASTSIRCTKDFSGKKFPHNLRAMRIVVEELLRSTFQNTYIASMKDLMATLEKI